MSILSCPQTPTYRIIQTTVPDEDGTPYPTYGIEAVDHRGAVLRQIPDISLDEKAVTILAHQMNTHRLALVHFLDVVEDFLDTRQSACI